MSLFELLVIAIACVFIICAGMVVLLGIAAYMVQARDDKRQRTRIEINPLIGRRNDAS